MRKRNLVGLLGLLAFVMVATGCTSTHRLGDFTAASSQNVRNLDYSVDEGTKTRVEGETCITMLFGWRFGPEDARIQRAMDNAIQNGRDEGIDGDLLVNVRMEKERRPFKDCMVVTGDLVSL